jgi:ribosome biogenesis GTPase A
VNSGNCQNTRPQELNILILGETGVGKSTWINGFYNYLTYSSLKEAEENDLCSKIPTKFIVTDDNFEEITVSTGEDTNEVQRPGQSATKKSKEHRFNLPDGTMIRLIDTPGIGDTSGIDQDKANFENILNTLSNHKELHGICILLKPNNARLSVVFRYCIKELLTYLHRDASKNIMFCFTNSRGTFYRPGDTMPVLKTLLKSNLDVEIPITKQTVYCYDSESYRFLAAIKNKSHPVKFPNEERENFVKSWEMSCKETNRMMEHIKSLTPHPIQNTMNLNFARQLVQKLTRPMAEITRNIQSNKAVLQDDIKEIEQTKANIKDLEKRKLVKEIDLEIIDIDFPKTVCTNSTCQEVYGSGDYRKIKYTSICHDHCYLEGVLVEVKGDAKLMDCQCMLNGTCQRTNCGHSYRVHMHVYYDTKEVDVEVEDKQIVEDLKNKLSAAEIKQKLIDRKHQLIEELNRELKTIQVASVKFAMFLKRNAITLYNDGMEKYLHHLIHEEESKIASGGSRKVLDSLQKQLQEYKHQANNYISNTHHRQS